VSGNGNVGQLRILAGTCNKINAHCFGTGQVMLQNTKGCDAASWLDSLSSNAHFHNALHAGNRRTKTAAVK